MQRLACDLGQNADRHKKLDLGGGHSIATRAILNSACLAGTTLKVRRFFACTPAWGFADLTNVGVDDRTLCN